MKNVFIACALFFATTSTSFAAAKVIAQYATVLDNVGDDSIWGVVRVLDDDTLTIEKWSYSWNAQLNAILLDTITTPLKPQTAARLLSNIARLSDVELVSTHADLVCMMMPMPGPSRALSVATGFDYNTHAFAGDLRVVETNSGCWETDRTSPKFAYDQVHAAVVMGALEVLGLELAN